MRWNRRAAANHALAFAVETAARLGLPLLVYEPEDLGSERQRQFVRDGAAENAARASQRPASGTFRRPPRARSAPPPSSSTTGPSPSNPLPAFDCEAYAVDSVASSRPSLIPGRAYAARSIRPKIQPLTLPSRASETERAARSTAELAESPRPHSASSSVS